MINAESIHQPLRQGDVVVAQDGGEYTVCYWFLDGVGVVPGRVNLDAVPNEDLPAPTAMLREPYKGAELPCLGAMVRRPDDYVED